MIVCQSLDLIRGETGAEAMPKEALVLIDIGRDRVGVPPKPLEIDEVGEVMEDVSSSDKFRGLRL